MVVLSLRSEVISSKKNILLFSFEQVDNSTSQEQILRMYKLGHEIPWDVRKPQPVPLPIYRGTSLTRNSPLP